MNYAATYLVYVAVIARAIGWNHDTAPIPTMIWVLLGIFGALLFTQRPLTDRFPLYPRWYALVQSGLVIAMLYRDPTIDFMTMLFLPLSFQAVQFFQPWIGFAWIGGFILAMAGMILFGLEWEAGLTLVLTGGGANLLMGSFAHLIKRTEKRRLENQRLFRDLQEAYRRLKDSAAQAEALAAVTERRHLTRELHDSLTQTLFSMNLAVQAAQLSTQGAPGQIENHLSRLQALSRNAAREVQSLTGQTPPDPVAREGLVAAIRRLAEERMEQDGFRVNLEVAGRRSLPRTVEMALYRIVQEALNNIIRHTEVRQALVRLCLESPIASLDVEDEGCGFDPATSRHSGRFGLAGMAERAGGIGWELEVTSHPGQGTRIHAEEKGT